MGSANFRNELLLLSGQGDALLGSKILIIDDEETNVRLLRRILQHSGFENISSTTDSRRTVGLFKEVRPDLVLSDWLMPHLDGGGVLGLLRQLIGQDDYLPIVVLTADVTPQTKRLALSMGATDFLTKPIDALEVTLRVGNLLKTRWSHVKILEQNAMLEEMVRKRTRHLQETLAELQQSNAELKRAEQAVRAFNAELEQRVHDRVADLTHAQEVLEMRNLDLQQFAYVASHDLKTPLRTISGFVELLRDTYGGQFDARGVEWIRRASDGAHRLDALIDNLLTYSQLDSRAQPFQPVDLAAVLDNAREDLGAVIQETAAEVASGALPTITGDRIQLTQLFWNILDNAIKYRGASCPRIHVSAQMTQGEWVFAIADNGIGIDPQHHEKIFELFRRLHSQRTFAGDGVGLSICRRIVTRHSGKIWVESQPGQGCTVIFTLPSSIDAHS
ncbi:MAG: response regulator [Verrucomicrobia bacterium]|nr:response regulator [Verrucomicrobiota bacterium]